MCAIVTPGLPHGVTLHTYCCELPADSLPPAHPASSKLLTLCVKCPPSTPSTRTGSAAASSAGTCASASASALRSRLSTKGLVESRCCSACRHRCGQPMDKTSRQTDCTVNGAYGWRQLMSACQLSAVNCVRSTAMLASKRAGALAQQPNNVSATTVDSCITSVASSGAMAPPWLLLRCKTPCPDSAAVPDMTQCRTPAACASPPAAAAPCVPAAAQAAG